jgi:group II intron reverse transcriptase/maturase
VDGQTAQEYAVNLEGNLQSLLDRFKSGSYKAPPVRRVHIPKGDGKATRPIGIPTFEDKVLQRAVAMVLEAIYEQDFRACSYGFRPKRSAHDALEDLWRLLTREFSGVVLEVDIKGYFDAIQHRQLGEILDLRVRDGVLRRAIGKWLNAGVLEEGSVTHPEAGTPQGGVVSPILSNVYLHEVLDKWFEDVVVPRLSGRARLFRYADDFVVVFSDEEDARRVMRTLPLRFAKYGLTIHPEKTKVVPFRRPPRDPGPQGPDPQQRPGTFDLLGFTHCWGPTRKGGWTVKRETARSRLNRAIKSVSHWCRLNRHKPIKEQQQGLARKIRGHCQYYGITGNSWWLGAFRYRVTRLWRYWLDRRSQRARMWWHKFERLLERYPLPPARCIHSALRRAANPAL